MSKKITAENIIFVLLLGISIASRFVMHSWNFTAVLAASFAFAFVFKDSKTKAILLPVLAMLISDLVIGFHSTMNFVYLGLGLALVPFFIFRKSNDKILIRLTAILSGSLIFFIVSNFGVWLIDGMYPMTMAGLIQCFDMGIPFYKNQLMADVLLTPLLVFAVKKLLALDFFQVVICERNQGS
jgi:hypothetical protein